MRVLVVEDEMGLAVGLRRGLEAEGFAVDTAPTGVDGLWFAQEHQYAVILLDIMLPGMNGFTVCERLRAERNWTPILMLTARDGVNDQVDGLDLGADDYLTKPFSFDVLLARIRALIRRGASERPTMLVAGDIRVDPASRRVWRGNTPIDVTAREFAVLEFLIRRVGQTVSKRDILDNVWDFDFEGDPNIV